MQIPAIVCCAFLRPISHSVSLATIGVCVFCAVTSVAAFFVFGEVLGMKRVLKSGLSVLLAITIIFSSMVVGLSEFDLSGLLGVKVSAASTSDLLFGLDYDQTYYRVEGCDNSASGSLVIPSTYRGLPVKSIFPEAFMECTKLTSITIPDSVTDIGYWAFVDCSSLTTINIPEGVTSIYDSTFYNCKSLTSITIPDSVTSIGTSAFSNCTSLSSITIPDGVTNIGDYAFMDCTSLSSITIPDSVTSIGSEAFYNTSYYNDAKNWDNDVLYIGNHLIKAKETLNGAYEIKKGTLSVAPSAFEDCTSLSSITIPDSVTSIGSEAFLRSSSLSYISVGSANKNYCSVDGVLFNKAKTELMCYPAQKSGVSYTIPNGVTSIDNYAFYNCSSLNSINIPNSVTRIGDYIFAYCENLTSIAIPDSVTSIGEKAFNECLSLADVYYSGSESDWGSITIGSNNYCLTEATIHYHEHNFNSDWIIDVSPTCTEDGSKHNTCVDCGKLVNEKIPAAHMGDWVITEAPTCTESGSAEKVCSVCGYTQYSGTTTVDSDLYPESAHNYGNDIHEIYDFSYPGADKLILTFSSNTYFDDDVDGVYVYIYDKSGEEFGAYTGYYLEDKTITIDGDSFSMKITGDGYYGFSFDSIVAEVIPDIVKPHGHTYSHEWTIDVVPTCTENGSKSHHCTACGDKTNLTTILALGHSFVWDYHYENNTKTGICSVCSAEITQELLKTDFLTLTLNSDGTSYVVADCESTFIGDMEIPSTYKGLPVTAIGTDAFRDCSAITSIVVPDSVTSIGGSAFRGCINLENLVLSENITSIPGAMCYGCTKLENLVITDGVSSIGGYAFSGCTSLKILIIPDSVINIGDSVFTNCKSLIAVCKDNSFAHAYAGNNNVSYILVNNDTNIDLASGFIYTDILGGDLNNIIVSSKNITCSIDTTYAGTGIVVDIMKDDALHSQYTLVVYGDTNGDSVCDVLDCFEVERASNGNAELSGAYAMAADSNSDDSIDITDYQAVVNRALAS